MEYKITSLVKNKTWVLQPTREKKVTKIQVDITRGNQKLQLSKNPGS